MVNVSWTTKFHQKQLKPEQNKIENTRGFLKYTSMAFQMIATILVFLFLGKFLDGRFTESTSLNGNQHKAFPIFTFAGSILGVATSLYLILKTLKK
jgi:F0F1-type ATP synthase assembly protein I